MYWGRENISGLYCDIFYVNRLCSVCVQIRHTCQCLVRTVHWEQYPDHIRDLTLKAYRPILIQVSWVSPNYEKYRNIVSNKIWFSAYEHSSMLPRFINLHLWTRFIFSLQNVTFCWQETLQEFGMVFWCNPTMRFNSSSQLEMLRLQAEHLGLVAWPSQNYPTSTYTHYGTFRFLNADRNRFLFHRMVEPDSALYCNTYRLHYKLMLPWVQCALNLDCVAPIGSQSHGCDLSRRPRYIYSGCHRYDSAAFNVILGEMFYVDTVYIPNNMPFYRESIALTKLPLAAIVHKSRSAGNTRTRNRKKYSHGRTYNNSVTVATDAVEMEFPWDRRTW